MSDFSVLGHNEEEVLTCICRSAARYMTGNSRPKEELQTEEQQKQAVEMERAVYAYLHKVASEKGW